jgi:hypothetical protein
VSLATRFGRLCLIYEPLAPDPTLCQKKFSGPQACLTRTMARRAVADELFGEVGVCLAATRGG